MKQILRLDWDIIAGIIAAVIAIVLHLLHVVEVDVLFTIVLVLLALLLVRDLRRESLDERLTETIDQTKAAVEQLQLTLRPSDAILIGPRQLREKSRRFVEAARGDMVWFNVCCLMFKSQDVFDLLLKPAIQNPSIKSLQFISDTSERDLWEQHVSPKVATCTDCDKVREPRWVKLPQTVSFILCETEPSGATEALLSFWGEPFMAQTTGKQVPRYVFRVQGHSDLIAQFVELERQHRLAD